MEDPVLIPRERPLKHLGMTAFRRAAKNTQRRPSGYPDEASVGRCPRVGSGGGDAGTPCRLLPTSL